MVLRSSIRSSFTSVGRGAAFWQPNTTGSLFNYLSDPNNWYLPAPKN